MSESNEFNDPEVISSGVETRRGAEVKVGIKDQSVVLTIEPGGVYGLEIAVPMRLSEFRKFVHTCSKLIESDKFEAAVRAQNTE